MLTELFIAVGSLSKTGHNDTKSIIIFIMRPAAALASKSGKYAKYFGQLNDSYIILMYIRQNFFSKLALERNYENL